MGSSNLEYNIYHDGVLVQQKSPFWNDIGSMSGMDGNGGFWAVVGQRTRNNGEAIAVYGGTRVDALSRWTPAQALKPKK